MARHVPRIYLEEFESEEFEIPVSQAKHLVSVLRLQENDEFLAFNKEAGEWRCSISKIKKQNVFARKIEQIRKFKESPKLCLAFCVIKPDNTRLVVEKATELGVTDIYPLVSKYTNNKIKSEKLDSVIINASEQCERLDVPVLHEPTGFIEFLNNLPKEVFWISALERKDIIPNLSFIEMKGKPCGFIVGPEGGFSDLEKELLIKNTTPVTISSNILKAETAAIACLSVYNAQNC